MYTLGTCWYRLITYKIYNIYYHYHYLLISQPVRRQTVDGRITLEFFLTLNAVCEEIVNDSFAVLGPALGIENGPSPFAFAHGPVKLSENAAALKERKKLNQNIHNKQADWH